MLNDRFDVIFIPQKVYLDWFWESIYTLYTPSPRLAPGTDSAHAKCYEVWYKEEDKEASKPAFLYTDTIRYDHTIIRTVIPRCTYYVASRSKMMIDSRYIQNFESGHLGVFFAVGSTQFSQR